MEQDLIESLFSNGQIDEIKELLNNKCKLLLKNNDFSDADFAASVLLKLNLIGNSEEWKKYRSASKIEEKKLEEISKKLENLVNNISKTYAESRELFLWVKMNLNHNIGLRVTNPKSQFKSKKIWNNIAEIGDKLDLKLLKETFSDMIAELGLYCLLSYEGKSSLITFASGLEIKKGKFYDFVCKMQSSEELKKKILIAINDIDKYEKLLKKAEQSHTAYAYEPVNELLPEIRSILQT